jgi:hypothetical protein
MPLLGISIYNPESSYYPSLVKPTPAGRGAWISKTASQLEDTPSAATINIKKEHIECPMSGYPCCCGFLPLY